MNDKVLYLCDPTKNTKCGGRETCVRNFEYCHCTTKPECAFLDEDGKPVKADDYEAACKKAAELNKQYVKGFKDGVEKVLEVIENTPAFEVIGATLRQYIEKITF